MPVEGTDAPSVRSVLARPDVSAVIIVSFVVMLGLGLVLPILPLYARSFGVTYAAAGLLISGFGVSRLAFDIAAGSLADRFGERRAGTVGLVWLGVCSALAGTAANYPTAVIFWSLGGVGSAVMFASTYGYLLKVVPQSAMARTLGVFYGVFNAGIIAGGAAGGFLADRLGLASPLFFYGAMLLLAAGILWWRLPERELVGAQASKEGRVKLIELLRQRPFIAVLATNFAYLWFVTAVFDTLIPLFGHDRLGMSPGAIGAIFSLALAAEFAVLYPAGAIADRWGGKVVVVPALTALTLATIALGGATSVVTLAVGVAVVGVASGFAGVPPAAMLAEVTPSGSSGLGVGAFRFAGDLAFVFGPMSVGAAVGRFGFRPAFVVATIPLVVATALMAAARFAARPEADK